MAIRCDYKNRAKRTKCVRLFVEAMQRQICIKIKFIDIESELLFFSSLICIENAQKILPVYRSLAAIIDGMNATYYNIGTLILSLIGFARNIF